MIKTSLGDGSAMNKFRAMIESQGVDSSTAHALCKPSADVFHVLPAANHTTDVFASMTGQISTPFDQSNQFAKAPTTRALCVNRQNTKKTLK